jgi:ribosome-binding protein aMBF1 (putative translation factor)
VLTGQIVIENGMNRIGICRSRIAMRDAKKIEALATKLHKRTSILTDDEVAVVTRETSRALGPEFSEIIKSYGLVMSDTVRWDSLRARCEEEREKRGLSLRDISSDLKIPQYRLRAIERGSLPYLKPEFAHRYFRYLGIEPWVRRWARGNAEIAKRSGITPFPRRKGNH